MDECLRFAAKLLDGESMTEVCREFGISLSDRSRRPVRYANQLAPQIEGLIVRLSAKAMI